MKRENIFLIGIVSLAVLALFFAVHATKETNKETAKTIEANIQANTAEEIMETIKETRAVITDENYVRQGDDDVFEGLSEAEKERILNDEPRLGAGDTNLYSAEIGTVYTDNELYQGTLNLDNVLPLVLGGPTWEYSTTTQKFIWDMEMKRIIVTSTGWILATSSIPVEFSLKEYKTCLTNVDFTKKTICEEDICEETTEYQSHYCEHADCSSEDAETVCGLTRDYMLRNRGRMIQENEIAQLREKQDQIELDLFEVDNQSGELDYETVNEPGEISAIENLKYANE